MNFTQGDTGPALQSTIVLASTGAAIDLTGASVQFRMRKEDDRVFQVDAAGELVDPDAGTVRYEWSPNDLAIPGTFLGRWRVTFGDGRIVHTRQFEIEVERA